jgi:hypothetical protein
MRVLLIIVACLFAGFTAKAQEKELKKTIEKKNIVKPSENKKIETKNVSRFKKTSQVSSSSIVNQFRRANNETLLQEMYSIQDERHRIENNENLSASERSIQIEKNKNSYNLKKVEFGNYVSSNGVVNIPSKEQKHYLSLLKDDNKEEEYARVVELIKKSK